MQDVMASMFVYKMMVVVNLMDQQMKEIETILVDYIWKSKKLTISLHTLQCSVIDGGLKLVNSRTKQKALKINWIFLLYNVDQAVRNLVYDQLDSEIEDLIWQCNLSKKDAVKIFGNHNFWTQTLSNWCEINHSWPK